MEAAEKIDCSMWAIFIGKNMFFKHEGFDLSESQNFLMQSLELLETNGTTGIYTLKFFENPESGKLKINEKTVCDGGSFNFKLVEPEERQQRQLIHYSNNQTVTALQDKISCLEQKLDQLLNKNEDEDEDEDEEYPQSIGDIINDAYNNPDKALQFINTIKSLFTMGQPQQYAPAAIGQVPTANQEDKLFRLQNALDTLEKYDPELVTHLEKLAQMAQNETIKFNMLIKML